ncbi:hypothetical protein CBU02nite_14330 [Clostridium butyricum]|uniref:Glycosyltransferase 2-like domain-containing protein n=1 Tax=Clostridium butyricum TaxID=1492 RepID=A0A512TKZ3_CLOBU|nr:glycosyltransferase [Clostridium butyricum]NOW24161.1 putative HAD superfamily hydrolase/GT2 family glycosyltransferase [Clostridium butyricum]GEQ20927.1 hypothetical protein CBU02nite_14330 [Clostridium butyricum]
MDINLIKESIENADIISFDIFDTLIFRIFNEPEDVFKLMENILRIDDFKNMRIKSQQMASSILERKSNFPHANLNEIYEYIEKNSKLNVDWEDVKRLEVEVECDCLFCNKEIYEIYEYAKSLNKRVVAVSDMYMSKSTIESILTKCGYLNFDEIYVSSDLRKTKYIGDIYEEVIKIEKAEPSKILHIGDNYNSDVVNAKKRGINSIYYNRKVNNYEKKSCDNISIFESINIGTTNVVQINNQDKDFWYNLGAKVGGPLYLGLLQWLEKELKNQNIHKVYFLSRDGYILNSLFNELGKESTYLYTSRRALLLASIDELDEDALNNLPPYTFGQQVKEILEYLNIDGIEEKMVKEAGFDSLDSIIKDSVDFEKMKKLFLLNKKIILGKCKEERENIKIYLNSIDFFNNDSIIFDCGWNGSSQYLLEKVLSKLEYKNDNLFLYSGILDNAKSRKQLNGKKFKSYLFGHDYNLHIEEKVKDTIVILELFFGAPHSSVKRYLKDGIEFENIEPDHTHKESICEGIQDYINQSYTFVNKYNVQISPEEAIEAMYRLVNEPTVEEAISIGNLPNIDGFVAQKNEIKYLANLKLKTLIKNPRSEIYWAKGLVVRPDINLIVKWFVRNKYKLKSVNSKKKCNIKPENIKLQKVKKAISIIKNEGLSTFLFMLKNKIKNRKNNDENIYNKWIQINESDILHKGKLEYTPLISIVVPVYNVIDKQLIDCIDSVINQTYDNWELCLVDDASTWESVVGILKNYESNPKINIVYRKENGHISKATNDGIKIAKGDFIAFLDCDDILAPNAIYEVTKKLNEDNEYDFIYSDEDKLTADGLHRHSPFFKPDWSPDTFMSLMYTCHFSVYRKSIIHEIGGLRTEYNGAQDYDFTLRFTEKANKIGHIAKILYHWREREESIASNPEAKPYALEAVRKCKEDALTRRGLKGTVEYVDDMFQYRIKYVDKNNSLVSIIIPSKDNYDILRTCIKSIRKFTSYKNYEILVIDNGSNDDNKNKYEKLCEENNCVYHYEKMEFNFSKMCNLGSEIANGDYFLFLNDDIEVLEKDWLEILLGHASIEHIGAVGAKLLYPNSNIIQHIGITNLKIGPSHSLIGFDDRTIYYYGRNRMDYNFIAVTGACLMIEKRKFEEVNGFDEQLSVAYNDVDICFKLIEKGYYNVVRNDVILYHHESISRGNDDANEEKKARLLKERKLLFDKHEKYRGYDPYYNKNLTECKVNYDINYSTECNKLREENKNVKSKWIRSDCIVSIDSIIVDHNIIITGWAFLNKSKINNFNNKYVVLINSKGDNLIFDTDIVIRKDVTQAIKGNGNLHLTGFKCIIDLTLLNDKEYKLGIFINNKLSRKKRFIVTDKRIILDI